LIAVDTNILVYAHREDSPWHSAAVICVIQLAEGRAPWAIPWACVHEFLAVVTHPKIYRPATPLTSALEQLDAWVQSPSLHLIGEMGNYWPMLRPVLASGRIAGPMTHDARIVAVCRQHGVEILWSSDRDYSRFGGLDVVNPLLG